MITLGFKFCKRTLITSEIFALGMVATACGSGEAEAVRHGALPGAVATRVSALTSDPTFVCNQDPRVWMQLVPLEVCAGARVFFDETFDGNGRTCGSCHPASNNYTIDAPFVAQLPASDPLFVAEDPSFDLGSLETELLHSDFALIKENVDGFEDVEFKFVSRSVSHTLSLATSIARDPDDGTSAAVVERTGWGGDGAPADGSLRSFLDGAINQHYPIDAARTPGVSFRFASEAEKDQVLAFQLALGRTADIDLTAVELTDPAAQQGLADFMNPLRGRCNHCHQNAGASFALSGLNRNFDTGVTSAPSGFVQQPDGSFLFDGGFGGLGLSEPNFITVTGQPDSFGDGTFSVPPLVEAADTFPFFHTHVFGSSAAPSSAMEAGVGFYATTLFTNSPAALELDAFFGAPIDLSGNAVADIARFLRVLNASFNLALASQRLEASHLLNVAFWGYREDVQKGLIGLADAEVEDALQVLETALPTLHSNEQLTLAGVRVSLANALAASDPAVRRDNTAAALSSIEDAKAALGTGMDFELGTGNLLF